MSGLDKAIQALKSEGWKIIDSAEFNEGSPPGIVAQLQGVRLTVYVHPGVNTDDLPNWGVAIGEKKGSGFTPLQAIRDAGVEI